MAEGSQERIVHRINELVDREHELRSSHESGTGLSDDDRAQLAEIEVQLDQCWDLLRQRRAKREFDEADDATVRDASVVEGYQQ
jgi:uncharacterized protein DUF2630